MWLLTQWLQKILGELKFIKCIRMNIQRSIYWFVGSFVRRQQQRFGILFKFYDYTSDDYEKNTQYDANQTAYWMM